MILQTWGAPVSAAEPNCAAVGDATPSQTPCPNAHGAHRLPWPALPAPGLPVEGAAAETIAAILTDRDPRAEAIAAVAAEAAGGRLLPRDGHRTAGTRRRWTDTARLQAISAARGQ